MSGQDAAAAGSGWLATRALRPEDERAVDAALEAAGRVLSGALGRAYSVWPWAGFDSDDEVDGEWLLPVYAAPDDDEDGLGHAVADAGLDGWLEWLFEQAREGL